MKNTKKVNTCAIVTFITFFVNTHNSFSSSSLHNIDKKVNISNYFYKRSNEKYFFEKKPINLNFFPDIYNNIGIKENTYTFHNVNDKYYFIPIDVKTNTKNVALAHPTYAGSVIAQNRMSLFTPPPNASAANTGSLMPWTDAFVLGGAQPDDKLFRMIYGQPYGGDNAAVVDGVYMNGMSAGQGTGVTAGGFREMLSYMNYDAAARETRTGSTPPRFIASAAVSDPNGTVHTVRFLATGATFTPALPAYWGRQLRVGMNVATNEIGAATSKIPQNTWNAPWAGNTFRRPFNTYFGTMTSWNTNADGTVAGITVDGWVVPQQNNYGLGNVTGRIPGVDTLDGSIPALDTIFTRFSAPAIMFGIYTKAFTQYEICDLEPQNGHGDINNPNGTIGSLVHECDHEVDMWNHDPTDYINSIHGYTLAEDNTGGGKLTLDSYGWAIEGGFALPVGYRTWNLLPGGIAYQAMGSGNINQHNIYAPATVGYARGSAYTAQNWQFSTVNGGNITSNIRLTQYRDTDTTPSSVTNDNSTVSVHLMWKSDATQNPTDETGAIGGQVVFNPVGYLYGIGIGAGGSFQNPNYGVVIDDGGNVNLPHGATSIGMLKVQSEILTKGNIETTNGYFREPLTTPASSSSPCEPGQFTDDTSYHYVCVAPNKWKRVALTSF